MCVYVHVRDVLRSSYEEPEKSLPEGYVANFAQENTWKKLGICRDFKISRNAAQNCLKTVTNSTAI